MAAVTPLKFLGATVIDYTTNVGWNGQESTMSVNLVEDPVDGDIFHLSNYLMPIGHPTLFNHGNLLFGGIVRNWKKTNSVDGRKFSVELSDPRLFFEGINIIIADYTYTVNVPNIFNVYGYLENVVGFGESERNEAGIQASKVLDALFQMSYSGAGAAYGGGISYEGISYYIDISGVPHPPADYRLAQTSITLAELLNEIAEVTSSTWICRLNLDYLGRWIISFAFQSRADFPVYGAIGNFVSNIPEASVRENGIELVNETTTKMLFGGKRTDMYAVFYADGGPVSKDPNDRKRYPHVNGYDSKDNPIWFYFGYDLAGNLVTTRTDNVSFTIDARDVRVNGLGDSYETDVAEMRAALSDIEVWSSFLLAMWPFEYVPDSEGKETDYSYTVVNVTPAPTNFVTVPAEPVYDIKKGFLYYDSINNVNVYTKQYTHNGIPNPHFKKAVNLKLEGSLSSQTLTSISSIGSWGNLSPTILSSYLAKEDPDTRKRTSGQSLYALVRQFAETNYGLKFMVTLPTVKMAVEPDTGLRRFNVLPTDGGWINMKQINAAVRKSILPDDVLPLLLEDNRLSCYVRYNNPEILDFTEIDSQDIVYDYSNKKDQYAFIKAQVDLEFRFLNYENAIGTRAIVTLPGRVHYKDIDENFASHLLHNVYSNMIDLETQNLISAAQSESSAHCCNFIKYRYGIGEHQQFEYNGNGDKTSVALLRQQGGGQSELVYLLSQEKNVASKNFVNAFDSIFNVEYAKVALIPLMAAIPLESQVDFYGPWISSVGTGKTEIEQDASLVPWNFNSSDIMNNIAGAKVADVQGNLVWTETGSFEVPGLPLCSLGDALVSGGPYVSDMSVSIGANGFTTSYRMSSWTPRFTKASNSFIDKMMRVKQTAFKTMKNMLDTFKVKNRNG
jgi:hypothetical protein